MKEEGGSDRLLLNGHKGVKHVVARYDANVGVARNMTAVSATERTASISMSMYRTLVQNITQDTSLLHR